MYSYYVTKLLLIYLLNLTFNTRMNEKATFAAANEMVPTEQFLSVSKCDRRETVQARFYNGAI